MSLFLNRFFCDFSFNYFPFFDKKPPKVIFSPCPNFFSAPYFFVDALFQDSVQQPQRTIPMLMEGVVGNRQMIMCLRKIPKAGQVF